MFDEWKKAWQQAVENFEREIQSAEDGLAMPGQRAHAMRRDLAAARAALNRLESDLLQARRELAADEEAELTARRRAEMAGRINDADTVRIASEFADRHAQRAGILRRKVDVLQDELTLRREELSGMEQQAALELERAEAKRVEDEFEFRKLDKERREKDAETRLEELKKRMGN